MTTLVIQTRTKSFVREFASAVTVNVTTTLMIKNVFLWNRNYPTSRKGAGSILDEVIALF
jgi:hypothetical protein